MHIVADQNIPALASLVADAGCLSWYSERQPPAYLLADADALLVRSITQVDEELLAQAPQLKFVATATIGTEHINQSALAERDITLVSAAGANADSVGEYVLTALLHCWRHDSRLTQLAEQDVAIVGAGNTGQATGRRLQALGCNVHYYDPPLLAQPDSMSPAQRQLNDLHDHWQRVLTADIISCHVPLTRDGLHATHHLFDIEALQSLHAQQLLINASRGAVVDNNALLQRCEQGDQPQLVLDVWEHEPHILQPLLPFVSVATAHIAGHSAEGKLGGAIKVAAQLHDFLQLPFQCSWQQLLPSVNWQSIDADSLSSPQALADCILQRYDIGHDDADLRASGLAAQGFDQLRKNYRQDNPRRQLNNQPIACHNNQQFNQFRQLGFAAYLIDA